MVSVGALGVGYLIMNIYSRSANLAGDVCTILFGSTSILTLTQTEVWLSVVLSVLVVAVFLLFYHKIFSVTFDEATGTKANNYTALLAILTALIIVVGMRMMGALLISSLVVFPALTSMRVFKSFKGVVVCSAILAVVCFFFGMVLSYGLDTAPGASVVIVNLVAFLVFSLIGWGGHKVKRVAMIIICVIFLVGCGGSRTVVISERNFIQQIIDVTTNPSQYRDREIRIVGMYANVEGRHAVYRYTGGCCPGDSPMVGFIFEWTGDLPNEGDWIEATGTFNTNRLILSNLRIGVTPRNEVVIHR
jgi:ABC-type Mn2+/Zn2+ transport system permease subunit